MLTKFSKGVAEIVPTPEGGGVINAQNKFVVHNEVLLHFEGLVEASHLAEVHSRCRPNCEPQFTRRFGEFEAVVQDGDG